jgi:hypothetical protein
VRRRSGAWQSLAIKYVINIKIRLRGVTRESLRRRQTVKQQLAALSPLVRLASDWLVGGHVVGTSHGMS